MMQWKWALLLFFVANIANAALLAGATSIQPGFFAISTPDCSSSYYASRSYSVDRTRSSLLPSGSKIHITAVLVPQSPSPAELAGGFPSDCRPPRDDFQTYPDIFTELSTDQTLNDVIFPILTSQSRGDGSKLLEMTIDQQRIGLEDLLATLRNFQPEESVQIFRKQTAAEAHLQISYAAAATFAENHFVEKTCTITHSCHKIFGIGPCDTNESCFDLPTTKQVLTAARTNSSFLFTLKADEGVPLEKISELESRLISRLMMSLFLESTRTAIGDVLQIKYGELRRDRGGQYEDQATLPEIVDSRLNGSVHISGLAEFAEPTLKRFYQRGLQ